MKFNQAYVEAVGAFSELCRETIKNLCRYCPCKFSGQSYACLKACPIERAIKHPKWKTYNTPANEILSREKAGGEA